MTAALVAGVLPRLSWHGPGVFAGARHPFWAAAFYGAGVLMVPAVALLLVGDRRARVTGAIVLVVAVGVWWPARQDLLGAEAADALRGLGGPPRAQAQVVSWSAAAPDGTQYRDGVLVVDYSATVGSTTAGTADWSSHRSGAMRATPTSATPRSAPCEPAI